MVVVVVVVVSVPDLELEVSFWGDRDGYGFGWMRMRMDDGSVGQWSIGRTVDAWVAMARAMAMARVMMVGWLEAVVLA